MAALSLSTALAFVALALTALARRGPITHPAYIAALLMTAGWLTVGLWAGTPSAIALVAEATANLCWLWFMASLADREHGQNRISAIGWIYIGLFAVQAVVIAALLLPIVAGVPAGLVVSGFDTVQMLFAAGALVLLHNLFEASRGEERQLLTWPMTALALSWGYALNLYAITYLSGEPAVLMQALRPLILTLMAVMLAVAALRPVHRGVRLSRPVVFRSLALAGVGAWLGLLALLAMLMPAAGQDFGGGAQIMVLAATIIITCLFLLSPRLRAHMRVWAAKHFYEHRFDYRAEWLRFTATLNQTEAQGQPIDVRVIKAIGEIVESPSGFLVTLTGDDADVAAVWPPAAIRVEPAGWGELFAWLGTSTRIIQLDEVRAGTAPADEIAAVPGWIKSDPRYWAVVPLAHMDRTDALVVLTRPIVNRPLDWEDFDLLRVAGRQAASHIAEARGSEALAESERFEEFHRRFAFMMHDVKNLASQMALLSRNAERHGEKPEFREDMVATLRVCADRLTQLMQRLSQQERARIDRLVPVDLAVVARRMADSRRGQHPVEVVGLQSAKAWGDRDTIEQLLAHILQNAIDASEADAVVRMRIDASDAAAIIAVEDSGCGMGPEFIRSQLFRPFHSTKDGGFGIGTYQARQLAQAMGGSLTVTSRPGEGSTFTLSLPPVSGGARQVDATSDSEAA